MSITFIMGFVGVSVKMAFGVEGTNTEMSAQSSTKESFNPFFCEIRDKKRYMPP
jgi:hypothetical protein